MSNHLKRIATPRTWQINRKQNIFITRPKPGAHSLEFGLALGVILRDNLKLAATMGEAKKLLNNNEVFVDGKRRKDRRYIVGLFDVLSFPATNNSYRVVLDTKGRLTLQEVEQSEATIKVCKIVGKQMLKGAKIQYNLHDGKNLITDLDARVGDSFVVDLNKMAVTQTLALKEGAYVLPISGKHAGLAGTLTKYEGSEAAYKTEGKTIETTAKNLFVVGSEKPAITING